jgi:hypothetical protein
LSTEKGHQVKQKLKDLLTIIKEEEKEIQLNSLRSQSLWKPEEADIVVTQAKVGDGEEGVDDKANEGRGQKRTKRRNKQCAAKTESKKRFGEPFSCDSVPRVSHAIIADDQTKTFGRYADRDNSDNEIYNSENDNRSSPLESVDDSAEDYSEDEEGSLPGMHGHLTRRKRS